MNAEDVLLWSIVALAIAIALLMVAVGVLFVKDMVDFWRGK